MAGLFASEAVVTGPQLFEDVAVTDGGCTHGDAGRAHG
ncbi:Uncharacterised protein [Mycobacterium tuberculosis]|uniref:Uncharacterized protein n=1 Tax=Mycobacterium tuberculosis TaxID=1773 RepID=A0A916L8J5_MYCTX|nr:Uncharacterised protein [Mycobacterium tuberculosis]COX25419.1 Uncharacterised protein [Mycobacterium tuberculosis]CPB59603.1 Uncharacterised protein [Mycobacterium tuberculosis]